MKRKTKAEKQREAAITKAYNLAFNRVQVNMLDIPAIYKAIGEAIDRTLETGKGATLAEALTELRNTYGRV
jgi:TPP-dependent pyruvate/acetoin dehydrogenase alpha subunit